MSPRRTKTAPRRRRSPEEAEREILDAAERFLAARPYRDLDVARLMDKTGLGRSSFYHYFRGRHDLVVRLLDRLGRDLQGMNDLWFRADDDPVSGLRAGYEEIARFWTQHGRLLRAIADASTQDRGVEAAHRAFLSRIVDGVAERIRRDVERGRIAPLDAASSASALVLMSERFLNETLGRSSPQDWRPVVDTLSTLWERALYGTVAARPVAAPRVSGGDPSREAAVSGRRSSRGRAPA